MLFLMRFNSITFSSTSSSSASSLDREKGTRFVGLGVLESIVANRDTPTSAAGNLVGQLSEHLNPYKCFEIPEEFNK